VIDLVNQILQQMSSDLKPEIRNEAANEIKEQHLSAARARTVLGWSPLFELNDGLAKTIGWYREALGAS
jgi:CDP-glucose 4,6-dehydratase